MEWVFQKLYKMDMDEEGETGNENRSNQDHVVDLNTHHGMKMRCWICIM